VGCYPYAYGWGYPYWGWGGYGGYYSGPAYGESAAVKLEVHPKEARIFVDGYYVGTVDDSHHFALPPGPHEVTLKLAGYKTHRFGVYASPGHAVKLRYDLAKGTGEDAPDELTPPAEEEQHAG
jgi:hypothetical protein